MKKAYIMLLIITGIINPQFIAGQETALLPAAKTLSFNGKFVNDVPDGFRQISENGKFRTSYAIGGVSDEMRELMDFRLFEDDVLLYQMKVFPGSDALVSNTGVIAAFDTRFHFRHEVIIHLFTKSGEQVYSKSYKYASLFGFSPGGGYFGVGTGDKLTLINTMTGEEYTVAHCNVFSFSEDESFLVTAKEGHVNVYHNLNLAGTFKTGFFYPRALGISSDNEMVSVIDKHHLITFSTITFEKLYEKSLPDHLAYRDLFYSGNILLAGVHEKGKGSSKGIIQVIDGAGTLISERVLAERTFQHFDKPDPLENKQGNYQSIPWPFVPFDQMHTVWNYYEQHMGNNWDTWSYLHQGLDIITPIDEPTYAVQAGYVKCVLTLGGDAYWRVAISQEQVPGYSNGWLYAHLVPGSIQVDVGDFVNVHDYLGDIIYWSDDWGHIHFVEIRDHGMIWYYNDDEWGINFNPLLALTPNNDIIAPEIKHFSANSKFGYLMHGSVNTFLTPDNLYGDIDIIALISDFHGDSPWELPAFKTTYKVKRIDNNAIVVPETLGRKLNHTYDSYSVAFFEDYAPLLFHKDNNHLPPSWMSQSRDYYQVLTRNNGDTLIDLSELYLAFKTADYYDGDYLIYIKAMDESGNMTIDSQQVHFNNGNISSIHANEEQHFRSFCHPNPASSEITINYFADGNHPAVNLRIYGSTLSLIKTIPFKNTHPGWNQLPVNVQDLPSGVYYFSLSDNKMDLEKFVITR